MLFDGLGPELRELFRIAIVVGAWDFVCYFAYFDGTRGNGIIFGIIGGGSVIATDFGDGQAYGYAFVTTGDARYDCGLRVFVGLVSSTLAIVGRVSVSTFTVYWICGIGVSIFGIGYYFGLI